MLFTYALLSFGYRWLVTILIVMWAGHISFWLGMLIGAGVIYSGTLAAFGDSITVTMAFWAPLQMFGDVTRPTAGSLGSPI